VRAVANNCCNEVLGFSAVTLYVSQQKENPICKSPGLTIPPKEPGWHGITPE